MACPAVAVFVAAWPCLENHAIMWVVLFLLSLSAFLLLYLPGHRNQDWCYLPSVARFCFLLLLPVWGFLINWTMHVCQPCQLEPSQALRTPDVIGLYLLYFAALTAYAISRRQPRRLRPQTEMWLSVFLLIGVLLCVALALHFGLSIVLGIMFGFVGLPLIAPLVVLVYFSAELISRFRRPGEEVQRPGLLPMAFWTAPVLCLWTGLHRLLFGAFPWEMFTETCEWTFSRLRVPPGDCHYLCTVAAQGSPWLVRPRRLGRRRGRSILVNRQLCVANAFEDLLHERWPRFGHICRKTYDRLGLPVSRILKNRFLANLTYLLMKPFEWLFSICLLLLDHEDPERRIDRMYR